MKILGIETSCDDTGVGIVVNGSQVLSSLTVSQIKKHAVFGGVVPEVAAREHLTALDSLVELALKEANLNLLDLDAIAVTQGPGLIGALLVGVSYARGLSCSSKIPLVPVNHVHAHVHGALLEQNNTESIYPSLSLVVSGGHTQLYYMRTPNDFELVGSSYDDACGECFDKVAKMLGLPYPGGPTIEKLALEGDPKSFPMPKPFSDAHLCFSYSGLKTHISTLIAKIKQTNELESSISNLCASFQHAALTQIVDALERATRKFPNVQTALIAGGVSANQTLRKMCAATLSCKTIFPPLKYCADNGAMIAANAFYVLQDKSHPTSSYGWDAQWDAFSAYSMSPHVQR